MACKDQTHKAEWFVDGRKCNYSAFNGYRRTPSAYSQVWCPHCYITWRTKAAYVDRLPDRNANDVYERLKAELNSPL